jgi:hypothetical protein
MTVDNLVMNLGTNRSLRRRFQAARGCATLPGMPRLRLKTLLFCLFFVGCAGLSAFLGPTIVLAQTAVDLELVLAVDVSLSMDLEEQRLQREGYVLALRDPEVQKAIASGPHGRIALTYMEWAGPQVQGVVVPWTIIDSPAAANAVAAKLEVAPIARARMTSISAALEYSKGLLAASGVKGIRRVIDVSGDGPNNSGPPVTGIRDELIAAGVVINGLPIVLKGNRSFGMFDLDNLDRYYNDCVIGGTGAFMIPVRELVEFRIATRRKLLLEISGLEPPARVVRVQSDGADCSVGERQWRRYMEGVPN